MRAASIATGEFWCYGDCRCRTPPRRPVMRRPEQVADYTCPEQAAREGELFFRDGPINVGLSALLPRPGDWLTHDYAGVPILLVRRADGSLGAFLNVCRHRGARVAEGCGNGARDF